jgi:hypothetical protein
MLGFGLEQQLARGRLVGELLHPLGQIRVAGKIARAGLGQKGNSAEQKNCSACDNSLMLKF